MKDRNLKKIIKTIIIEELQGTNPPITIQLSTIKGTTLFLYKGDVRQRDNVYNDIHFYTPSKFKDLISNLNNTRGTVSDEEVKSVLRNLTSDELSELAYEKIIVTTNIPNEIVDLTGKKSQSQG